MVWVSHTGVKVLLDKMQSSELKEEPCLHPQDGAVGGPTASVKESLSPSKESSLQIKDLGPESAHRLFRSCHYPEAPGLLRSVRKLKDLCRQWLRPDIHSTEEMLELLTVEQFLAMLPKAVRVWVHGHHPQNIRQAVFLVETLKRATSSSNNAVKTEMPSTVCRMKQGGVSISGWGLSGNERDEITFLLSC